MHLPCTTLGLLNSWIPGGTVAANAFLHILGSEKRVSWQGIIFSRLICAMQMAVFC